MNDCALVCDGNLTDDGSLCNCTRSTVSVRPCVFDEILMW